MKNILNLAKTFVKANAMSKPTDKGQQIKVLVLSLFSMFFIMLPVLFGVGIMVKTMTEVLTPVGFSNFGLQLMLYITCIFTMVFGMNVLFSELYFVNDIEHLLPLPLKAYQIVGSKFISVYYMENIMQFMMVFSCIIGYGLATGMEFYKWILAIIGIMFLPIAPLAICGIVSMLIMGLTKIIKDKDIIHKMTIIVSFIVLVVVVLSIGSLQTIDLEVIVENMAKNSDKGFGILGVLFPTVLLYVESIANGNILSFLGYILINLFYAVAMLIIGELLYFKGVIGLTTVGSKKKGNDVRKLILNSKKKSPWYAYFLKELRILLRTPAYLTNCIGINFIWPIFIYAVYKLKGYDYSLGELRDMYINDKGNIQLMILVGIIGVSILVTALNSISSNSISREGKHFSFMKYIPVEYKIQWNVKALIGAMFAAIGVLVYIIPGCLILKIPMFHTLIYILLCLLFILGIAYMGTYIDSIQPKLIWDDELGSLRENYNTFFAMAIAIGIAAVVCVGGFFIFKETSNINIVVAVLAGFVLIMDIIIAYMTKKVYIKNIEEQEEV